MTSRRGNRSGYQRVTSSLRRPVAVVACVAVMGVAAAVTVGAPAGAGDVPEEEQVDVPIVDGVTIVATYGYERMPFFEGGFILKPPQLDNFVSIDCGPNGEVNPAGGPEGAPECGFHPAVTEATVTITGRRPWFEIAKSFQLVPYWSFDDETYVQGNPITIKAPKSGQLTLAQAGPAYLGAGTLVNVQLAFTAEKIEAWDATTTGAKAAADVEDLAQAFDDAKADLRTLKKGYRPAKKAIKAQIKAIDVLLADLAAAGGINDGVDLKKWKQQFDNHLDALVETSDAVRAKLGLDATDGSGDQPLTE